MKILSRLALIVLATTGCMVGDDPLPTADDLPPLMSEASLSNNAQTAFNYFVSKGLTKIQSAGIVGNLMQESSVRPTAVEFGGGPGRGIAQWSVNGRWNTGKSNMTSFAAARGASRWALMTQLDFIWHELESGNFGLSQLQAATTLTQAVYAFQAKYEICGTCAQAKRIQYAQQALADYGGSSAGPSDPPPPGDPGDTAGDTCHSGTLGRDVPENTCVESMYDGLWYQCSNGSWIDRWSDPDPCVAQFPL